MEAEKKCGCMYNVVRTYAKAVSKMSKVGDDRCQSLSSEAGVCLTCFLSFFLLLDFDGD